VSPLVIPGLDPGIRDAATTQKRASTPITRCGIADGRVKPGHDEPRVREYAPNPRALGRYRWHKNRKSHGLPFSPRGRRCPEGADEGAPTASPMTQVRALASQMAGSSPAMTN